MRVVKCTVLLLIIMMLCSCSLITEEANASPVITKDSDLTSSPEVTEGISVTPTPTAVDEAKEKIMQYINGMTIEEKIGQLVITGYSKMYAVVSTNINFCGVILFKGNIPSAVKAKNDINKLKAFRTPFFVSVDQEGGRVSRLPEESGSFEAALEVGNRNDREYAYSFGSRMGIALREIGFNVNFAPVLDIFSNPSNTVIADRAFGKTPERVSDIGTEVMKGLKDEGIIPTAKHFPGHGDTIVDSHAGLPVVTKTLKELNEFEFAPFKKAIENNVVMIMAGHIVVQNVDSMPATLSYEMITNVLRKQLKYDGVVITDDLGMGAISKTYSVKEAAVLSFKAGCDIVLFSQSLDKGIAAYNGLLEAYNKGEISEDRINESLVRILSLKDEYGIIKL